MQNSRVLENFRRRVYHELIGFWGILVKVQRCLNVVSVTFYGEREHVGDNAEKY